MAQAIALSTRVKVSETETKALQRSVGALGSALADARAAASVLAGEAEKKNSPGSTPDSIVMKSAFTSGRNSLRVAREKTRDCESTSANGETSKEVPRYERWRNGIQIGGTLQDGGTLLQRLRLQLQVGDLCSVYVEYNGIWC